MDGGMSSDCSDDEYGDGGQMPVVYPWMKKIHVAGASKFKKNIGSVSISFAGEISSTLVSDTVTNVPVSISVYGPPEIGQ